MAEQMLMKDGLGEPAIKRIALAIHQIYPEFDNKVFVREANKGLQDLELKQRVNHIIHVLKDFLPEDFKETAKIFEQIPRVWDRLPKKNESIANFKFAIWPVIDYVSIYGINDPKTALKILEKLTDLFSAEFAIRTFIVEYPTITFKYMEDWVLHKDEHVRRLVSEGLRPRLPWGLQLKSFIKDPKPILPFLEKLKLDKSLYVRRSVANNLNDIAKDHPQIVIGLCQSWKKNKKSTGIDKRINNQEQNDNIDWVIKHALRSLIKLGKPEVFPLLGYTNKPKVELAGLKIQEKHISPGGELSFSFKITSKKNEQKFVIDYVIYFMGANGLSRKKVFKLKNVDLNKDELIKLKKIFSFKPISTRRYYSGEHVLAIHINGVEFSRVGFTLQS